MSPDFRKVAVIAAALGLLVSLFIALRDDDDTPAPATATAAATTAPAPTIEATPGPTVVDLDATTGDVARVTVERGRDVVLNVTADVADHVHVHGYDLKADVAPGKPAKIAFTADVAGRFEVELEERHRQIAELAVEP